MVQEEEQNVVAAFREAMAKEGLVTNDEIIADGKKHRFHVDGDTRGRDNGWYKLHFDDHPAGIFGTWKDSDNWHTWVFGPSRRLSAAERRDLEKRIAHQRKEHEEEQRKVQEEASARSQAAWALGRAGEHAYLTKKSVKAHGTLVSEDGALMVPLEDSSGKLWSIQFIQPNGEKKFQWGGRIQGCYFVIAKEPPSPEGVVLICEGFATGGSLHQATDLPVVVAFNTGNLALVAEVIRAKFPKASLIFCADNDQWTMRPVENPGLHYAKLAAAKVRAAVAIPSFKYTENRPTDFNDLAQAEGLGRVAEIVEASRQDAYIEANAVMGFLEPAPPDAEPPVRSELTPWTISFPHEGKRGPLATLENVAALLDGLSVRARYDIIRKDIDILIPGSNYLLDTAKNDKLTWIISQASLCQLPLQRVAEFVSHIAGQFPYNPVGEWILSKPWDGQSRLQEFYNTIVAVQDEDEDAHEQSLKEVLMKRWMLSAVAAAFEPKGVSAHGVLTLQGPQNLGKTAWFKRLVPRELEFIADGLILDPKDKDSVYSAVTHWLVELGEVDATFRKADIAQLKSFLTKDKDVLRRPYARLESAFARRTVFFASVNPEDYLADPTGNRRFWTIQCEKINYLHDLDMQQVWAEFHAMYKAGEPWVLQLEEFARLETHNRDFEAANAAEELILTRLNWDEPKSLWKPMTATDIALRVGLMEPNERTLKQVSRAIREKTGERRYKSSGRSVYLVPDIRRVEAI